MNELTDEAIRNADALLHPQLQQPFTNLFTQLEGNIPRMLSFPTRENLFTNAKLVQNDIPESSSTGEQRNLFGKNLNWMLSFELSIANIPSDNTTCLEILTFSIPTNENVQQILTPNTPHIPAIQLEHHQVIQ